MKKIIPATLIIDGIEYPVINSITKKQVMRVIYEDEK